jgi:uncharacterized membrane protein
MDMTLPTCMAILGATAFAAAAPLLESTAGWSNSASPASALSATEGSLLALVSEGNRTLLRAAFGFGDERASEPVFITRRLDPPMPRRPILRLRFAYRFATELPAGAAAAPLAVPGGFIVRLRTSPTEHTNYEVPPVDGRYPTGSWVDVDLSVNLLGPKVRNVYGTLFSAMDTIELTFRLDDIDELNARGTLDLADIAFELAPETVDEPYSPAPSPRSANEHLRVLAVPNGADGWYGFDRAARLLDPRSVVLTSPFRGLHFPIWDFPVSREQLLGYDAVALGDVDPYVLTRPQMEWLADAVHSGTGLLLAGGPWSLGQAKGQPQVLRDLLPVTWEAGAAPVSVSGPPQAMVEHELLAGFDPALLGLVKSVCPVQTKESGGTTLLAVGNRPLLVAGMAGQGRVLVLTAWAQPGALGDGSFMTTPAWQPFAARLLAWLTARPLPPVVVPPVAMQPVRLAWRYAKSALAPGVPFGLEVRRDPLPADATRATIELLVDGEAVWSQAAEASPAFTVGGVLPELAAGPVVARVRFADDLTAELAGTIVDRVRPADFFPLITYLPINEGGHWADPGLVEELVAEVDRQGLNTIALGGFGGGSRGGIGPELRGLAEERAGARGLASILEYTTFTFLRRGHAHEVSPFDPAFPARLAERYGPAVEESRHIARLLSVKFLDEPTVTAASLDAGEITRAAFRERAGRDLPERSALGASAAERIAYARFLSEYIERDFAAARAVRDQGGATWDLLQTYMAPGYGAARPLDGLEDAYRWTRPADRFDFDVYPYFYPTSERIRFVQANWCFAASRVFGRALGKPWGFYVELDDRNWPFQQNPAEASAECAHTAIAAGAEYLNTFILRTCTTGSGARPERWAKTGEAFRTIRRLGPLLTRLQRIPARVAVLFPEAHWFAHNGYPLPQYTLALLAQALGDADVIHEELFAQGQAVPADALVLCGVEVLRRDAFERLLSWVEAGGTAVLDRLPASDDRDLPLPWPESLRAGPLRTAHGAGLWILLAAGLEQRCREAVEGHPADRWQAQIETLRRDMLPHLQRPGLARAEVLRNEQQAEVGIRCAEGTILAVVVNHDPAAQETTVRLSDLPFVPGFAQDLATFEPVGIPADRQTTIVLDGTIPGRGARYVALYPQAPAALRLRMATETVRPGAALDCTVDLGVPGTWLLDLTVTDAAGKTHDRLGGALATDDGRCTVRKTIPLNAKRGSWRIVARAPQVGLQAEATFSVE